MVSAGKPAPDLFLLAAATMAAAPARCLVIEDSEVGIRAAKAAGMTVFGFTGASHVRPKTTRPGSRRPARRSSSLRCRLSSNSWAGLIDVARCRAGPVQNGTALAGRRPRCARDDPAPSFHVLSGDVLHHHRRADFGCDRRAHALLGLCGVHHGVVLSVGTAPIAHWVWGGGWLADMGALDRRRTSHVTRASGLVAAIVIASAATTLVGCCRQRPVHAARRGRAVVWMVRVQRRQRARGQSHRGPRVRGHDARPHGHPGRLDAHRHRAHRKPTAVGAATAIVVGLVAITPAAGFVGPMSAIALGAIAAFPATSLCNGG